MVLYSKKGNGDWEASSGLRIDGADDGSAQARLLELVRKRAPFPILSTPHDSWLRDTRAHTRTCGRACMYGSAPRNGRAWQRRMAGVTAVTAAGGPSQVSRGGGFRQPHRRLFSVAPVAGATLGLKAPLASPGGTPSRILVRAHVGSWQAAAATRGEEGAVSGCCAWAPRKADGWPSCRSCYGVVSIMP